MLLLVLETPDKADHRKCIYSQPRATNPSTISEVITMPEVIIMPEVVTTMSASLVALYVFVLACFIGYFVIWGVTPSLHTPLISLTNAISGIIIVGALLVAGFDNASGSVEILGFLAVLLASINIFGGFWVTQRMLAMFKKK